MKFFLSLLLLIPVFGLTAQPVLQPRDFTGVWLPDSGKNVAVRKGYLKIEISAAEKGFDVVLHHTQGSRIILTKGRASEEKGQFKVTWISPPEGIPASEVWLGDEVGNLVVGGQPFRRARPEELTSSP